jgi:hypothetical protein
MARLFAMVVKIILSNHQSHAYLCYCYLFYNVCIQRRSKQTTNFLVLLLRHYYTYQPHAYLCYYFLFHQYTYPQMRTAYIQYDSIYPIVYSKEKQKNYNLMLKFILYLFFYYMCKIKFNYNLSHTPDVHLKPDPNATCITRSPFFKGLFFWVSMMYSSSYHIEEELVLP